MGKVLAILLGIVVLLVVVGLLLPSDYSVESSTVINASNEEIHALVGDLKAWPEWTPFQEEDPTIETTLGEKTSGTGASQSWSGDSGAGELEFTMSDVMKGVEYDMAFIQGDQKMPSKGAIRYQPVGGGIEVTWRMNGDMDVPVIGGYLARIMKPQIEEMFARGLEKLKAKAES